MQAEPAPGPATAEESSWAGVDETIDDPEEERVIFCALDSFSQYAKTAHLNSTHFRRQAFYALPQAHWQMLAAPPFNYLATLDQVDDAIESNAALARAIVKQGLNSFAKAESGSEASMPDEWAGIAKGPDVEKARSTLRQFYRDWSAEGVVERDACYGPVFDALEAERSKSSDGSPLSVLVPGTGLGRLLFDLCLRGYNGEGNEISYHQLLASSYILNHAEHAGQHEIFPWIHSFSNHKSRSNQFKSYKIPDVHPAAELSQAQSPGTMQMCAADFLCLYSDADHKNSYDAVATVFFLDTAPNLIRYLQVIKHCLKPGGVLINVGPLLWHWENQVNSHHGYDGEGDYDEKNSLGIADPGSFELSEEEVIALVEQTGFVMEKRISDIRAPYVQDPQSMLQTVYNASHWVARKPLEA